VHGDSTATWGAFGSELQGRTGRIKAVGKCLRGNVETSRHSRGLAADWRVGGQIRVLQGCLGVKTGHKWKLNHNE